MPIDNVLDVARRVQYVAAAAQTAFDYGFSIFDQDDLVVEVDGVVKTITTDYTVSGVGDDAGGTVTFLSAMSGDEVVTIYSDTEIARSSDISQNGPLASSTINDELDKLFVIAQELKAKINRALRLPFSAEVDSADAELSPIANWLSKYVFIGADGVPEPSTALEATALSQSVIAALLNPQTTAESALGITPANYSIPSHEKCGYFLPERYANNTTPGTTVMQTGVERAIAVAAQAGGGTVLLTDRYRMSGPLAGAAKVDIFGTGEGSSLEFPAGHGITLGWLTGFGSVTYDNFQLIGSGSGDYYGIYQAGTLDDADELYGLNIRNLLITDWNVGIKLRTVRNLTIESNWIQDIDRGIELAGKNLVVNITRNKIVKAAGGGGSGASTSIVLDSFNYTAGAGVVPPEGVQIFNNLLYGSDACLTVGFTNYLNFTHNDLQASVYGVDFTTAQLLFNITDNYFDMSGANVAAGIYGRGMASEIATKVNIHRNAFNGTTLPATAVGIQINDAGNQNQSFISARDNYFLGDWDSGDILFNNAGPGEIIGNRCTSSTPTNSISVPNVANGTVYISHNLCAKAINYAAAEAAAGEVLVGPNVVSGTTKQGFPGMFATPAFSAGDFTANGSMTWTVEEGDVVTYAYELVGNKMTVLFNIATTTVGGTPNSLLQIAIPAGKTAAKTTHAVCSIIDNNVRSTGTAIVAAAGTVIAIERTDAANWSASTDLTYVRGQIVFEVQ